MDFRDRHMVITGGAGALGTALVEALVNAGAGLAPFAVAVR